MPTSLETIAVIGTGYVGLVAAAGLAHLGQRVLGVDNNGDKIAQIQQGRMPIFEPGLDTLVQAGMASGRLSFTTDIAAAMRQASMVFLAVGTPTDAATGQADLRFVWQAIADIAPHLRADAVIVTKSTLPLGTNRLIAEKLWSLAGRTVAVVSNPEFLREGQAINDFLKPERIVLGGNDDAAVARVAAIYAPLLAAGCAMLRTDLATSELIKYAANGFLAVKIAFINEIAALCEKTGANVGDVAYGIGLDSRIGQKFLSPGPGYGGSCFPKDTLALAQAARALHTPLAIVEATITANGNQQASMARKIIAACGGDLRGKKLAVLGLAFKAGTDDMRDAPALVILPQLLAMGASIAAYDPKAMSPAQAMLPGVAMRESALAAMAGADAAIILTEWPEFAALPPDVFSLHLRQALVVDLRNLFLPAAMAKSGIVYHSLGRPTILPEPLQQRSHA